MSGKRFLKGFILRGGPATADGAFPLGRKRRADTAAYLPHHRCSAYLFICQGGAAGRPLVFEEGWSSGRGGERPSSEGSPSPIPYPFPCLLGGFAFHERFRNGGFTLNRQSRRKALSVEMPDPQGAGGADEASGAQIGAEIPGLAAIPSHEHGRHHRRQARSEDARD